MFNVNDAGYECGMTDARNGDRYNPQAWIEEADPLDDGWLAGYDSGYSENS